MPLRLPAAQHAASRLKSTHLLRALLRAATYLPDAHARTFLRRYIVHRFKVHQPAQNATSTAAVQNQERYFHGGGRRRKPSVIEERTRLMQRKARKGLNYLQRANQGHYACLQKILMLTYGRIGPRRYALLDKLLQPDSSPDGRDSLDESSPLQKLYYSNKRFLQFFDAPAKISDSEISISISDRYSKLRSTIVTQRMSGISIGRSMKSDKVIAPSKNAWQRAMPMSRARNIVRRWYAETMTKLLPPLPEHEWDELRAYATGQKRCEASIKRRTPVGNLSSQATLASQSAIDQGLVLAKPSRALKPGGLSRPHAITPHFMRRMYGKILCLSCKLVWNEEYQKWSAIWGSRRSQNLRAYTLPADEVLFAGVDSLGKVPRKKRANAT
ncbi:hypothetical protein BDV96DRAFT_503785 [Lophiotrema nucula]|uniref:LYR motif-containing protein Cup1-like N-terminal domain-containing protein n=1 Tax=Lophiotrema nucula TaxID=690887 RepID=A0A6A5YPM0_9PLEO|nr:hypothetical protein BDV96DRAFT_503785 [Lophiotrema nucula]